MATHRSPVWKVNNRIITKDWFSDFVLDYIIPKDAIFNSQYLGGKSLK